jgi:AraC-like DNA-binding protein
MQLDDATHGLARKGFASGYPFIGVCAMRGCATLEAAIRCLQHLYGLASRSIRVHLKIVDEQAVVGIEADCAIDEDQAVLEDTYLSWVYLHCLYFLGRPFAVSGVTTRAPRHFNLGHPHYAIGAPTRFGRHTTMHFPKSLLTQRGVSGADDNPSWECFRLWLDCVQGQGSDGAVQAAEVYSTNLDELALQSSVSRSTIYRRLRASEGGIRSRRQRVLTDAALRMLRETDFSVEAIGAELGYSDARSFRRFLKAATGKTPQEHRRNGPDADIHIDQKARQRLRQICRETG